MLKFLTAAAVAVVLLAAPALAPAQDNSAIDQYTENVPGDSGGGDGSGGGGESDGDGDGGSSGSPDSGSDSSPAPPLDSSDSSDAGGDAAPSVEESDEPAGSDSGRGENEDDEIAGGAPTGDDDDGLPSTSEAGDIAVTPTPSDTDSDSGGIGALPIILGVTLLAALGYAASQWLRRRPSATTPRRA